MPLKVGDWVTITLTLEGKTITPLAAEVTHFFGDDVYVDYWHPSLQEWKSAKLVELPDE